MIDAPYILSVCMNCGYYLHTQTDESTGKTRIFFHSSLRKLRDVLQEVRACPNCGHELDEEDVIPAHHILEAKQINLLPERSDNEEKS